MHKLKRVPRVPTWALIATALVAVLWLQSTAVQPEIAPALHTAAGATEAPTIELSDDERSIRVSAKAGLRFHALYTQEGYWGESDHGVEGSQGGVNIRIADVAGKHEHMSIFAIDVNGGVASKVFRLTEGAALPPSQLTVTNRKDNAIEISSPAGIRYSALFTKDGYWGIDEYPSSDPSPGQVIGLDGVTSSSISVAAIDAEGDVVAQRIPLPLTPSPAIELSEDGNSIHVSSEAGLRFHASYTKEGYWGKTDHEVEGSTGANIQISGVRGKHEHISIFAIDVNGEVASRVVALTDGASPPKSRLTVKQDDDAIRISSPAGLRFSALFTKEGFWGIHEYPSNDPSPGETIGLPDRSEFISLAAIDSDGNVIARKIQLR